MRKILLNGCLLLLTANVESVFGQNDCVANDPLILSIDSLSRSLTREKLFVDTTELQRLIALPADQLPRYTDEEMRVRMQQIPSLFRMDYNSDVKAFIDLFVYRRRELMTKLLAASQIYFPIFEQTLDEKKMPDELKYLALIESALNPNAVSCAGATGLWQLMIGTGKEMGCSVNSYVDERRDPMKSTRAAAKYLQQLYSIYGDWQLAIAAYNSGPGWVNKAIARSGSRNFWSLKYYLPAETRSYVPTFIAMAYVMHYADDYKLKPAEPKRELYAVDTVNIVGKVTLQHIANNLGMPVEELQFLNPSLKVGIIPPTSNGFSLNLPVNYFVQFESKKEQILNDPSFTVQEAQALAATEFEREQRTTWYKVRSGDNLVSVARRHGVSVSDIKRWNKVGNYLQAGQRLKIVKYIQVPVSNNSALAANKKVEKNEETVAAENNKNGALAEVGSAADISKEKEAVQKTVSQKGTSESVNKVVWYKVQSGDTLWTIAQRYPGITVSKLKNDNGLTSNSLIKKGQVIKIVM